jgi:endonuclease YncB( thermonuclease family)
MLCHWAEVFPLRMRVSLISLLFVAKCAYATDLHGKVVAVVDGDTITVLDAQFQPHKVRLGGIDAPEKEQAFGQASKQHLSGWVFGRVVRVSWSKLDRYNRIVGKVMLGDVDVCLAQVRMGMAWHYKHYQSEQAPADQASYAATESVARSAQVGLWADFNPVAPWDFRRASRRQPNQLPATIGLVNEAQPVVQP